MNENQQKILVELMGTSKSILELIQESSSSSSEGSEDEDDNKSSEFMLKIAKYSEQDFKSHFRLNRSTANHLISIYSKSKSIVSPNLRHGGRPKLGADKEVFIFLFYLGNIVAFSELGNLFGVPKSSAWLAVKRVSGWLVSVANEYVIWPEGGIVKQNAKKFGAIQNLPGVLGAIGCTDISVYCAKLDEHCNFDKKENTSIVLQAVIDADKKFVDIFCGEPGTLNDSEILKRSVLHKKAQANYKSLFPHNTFLIGDSSYPNLSWLIPPFRNDVTLTEGQIKFNTLHSLTRATAQDTFAILKSRFRRIFKFTEQKSIRGMNNLVASACILHNICITMQDDFKIVENEDEAREKDNDNENLQNTQIDRRQLLFDYLCEKGII